MTNRYRYEPLILRSDNTLHHYVVDTEAGQGDWNAWEFSTEGEALLFIGSRTVIPFRLRPSQKFGAG